MAVVMIRVDRVTTMLVSEDNINKTNGPGVHGVERFSLGNIYQYRDVRSEEITIKPVRGNTIWVMTALSSTNCCFPLRRCTAPSPFAL